MRTNPVRLFSLALPLILAAGSALAQTEVLATNAESMVGVKATSFSAVQDVRCVQNALQRGVNLDGTLRAGSLQGWAVAGNSIDGGVSAGRIGDVRLDTGTYSPNAVDIALPAAGFSWVVGRTENHRQQDSGAAYRDSDGYQGKNWFQTSQPEIVFYDADDKTDDSKGDIIYIVYGADRFIELVRTEEGGPDFKAMNGAAGIVHHTAAVSTTPETYTYIDQHGTQITFLGFDSNSGTAKGQFWKMVDAAGNTAFVGNSTLSSSTPSTGYDGGGRITAAYDSADRRYTYTYSTIDGTSRLTQVKAETKASGTWASPSGVVEVAKVDYAYYQPGDNTYGDNGNLKLVTVTTPLTDSGVSSVRKTHYRYWKGTYNSSTNPGYPNSIMYVIDPEGYRRADWADSNLTDDDPLTLDLSVSGNKAYVSTYIEYNTDHQVWKVWQNGQCGCGGSSINGLHTLTYSDSSSLATYLGTDANVYNNGWGRRTTVVLPDTSARTHYFDETGQALSTVMFEKDPTMSPSIKRVYEVTRDTNGVVKDVVAPSRNSSYDHSSGAIAEAGGGAAGTKGTSELVSGGDIANLVKGRTIQDTESGDINYVRLNDITSHTYVTATGIGVARPMVSAVMSYPVATTSYGAGTRLDTTITYDWWEDSDDTDLLYIVPKIITTTNPAVVTAHNGSNSATSTKRYLRKDGTTAFTKDAGGVFNYTAYTNGQLTKQIRDCQTNHGTDFASGDDPDTDFGVTETSAGLRLITTYTNYTYDSRDRVVITQGPQAPYTLVKYDNLNRVVATGQYSSTSGLAVGDDPITEDTNRLSLSRSLYDELGRIYRSTTYYIDPSTGLTTDEDIDSSESLTSNTWWDADGRVVKTKGPGGIQKTLYDRIGRPTSRFVIADDGGETAYSDMDDVSGDKVMEQSITNYGNTDTALTGKVQMSASISRWQDDTSTTGALDTNADSDDDKFTEGNIKGRISINVAWMDELGRATASASYGTNGMVDSSGHDFDLSPSGTYVDGGSLYAYLMLVNALATTDSSGLGRSWWKCAGDVAFILVDIIQILGSIDTCLAGPNPICIGGIISGVCALFSDLVKMNEHCFGNEPPPALKDMVEALRYICRGLQAALGDIRGILKRLFTLVGKVDVGYHVGAGDDAIDVSGDIIINIGRQKHCDGWPNKESAGCNGVAHDVAA